MEFHVDWSREESGVVTLEAESAKAAVMILHSSPTRSKSTTITGVTGDAGEYFGVFDFCESCSEPILEGEDFSSGGDGICLCRKCAAGLSTE